MQITEYFLQAYLQTPLTVSGVTELTDPGQLNTTFEKGILFPYVSDCRSTKQWKVSGGSSNSFTVPPFDHTFKNQISPTGRYKY